MTRATSLTGSGFSSSRGGGPGRGQGMENMALTGQKGKLVPAAQDHGIGTIAQPLQEEKANEGDGVQRERYLQFLGLHRVTLSA